MNTTRLSLLAGGALIALLPLAPLCAQSAAATPAAPKGPNIEARLAKMKEKLSLTDDQVKSIKALFEDQKTKLDAIHADTTLTKDQQKEKAKPIIDDTKAKIDAVFTPEQKAKADQLRKYRERKKKEAPAAQQ
jgi:Spy/CpxP family protein refolding chaperone